MQQRSIQNPFVYVRINPSSSCDFHNEVDVMLHVSLYVIQVSRSIAKRPRDAVMIQIFVVCSETRMYFKMAVQGTNRKRFQLPIYSYRLILPQLSDIFKCHCGYRPILYAGDAMPI